MITRVYALRTGKPFWVVSKDIERDVFMSADEAKAYGLVDIVGDEMIDDHYDTDPVCFRNVQGLVMSGFLVKLFQTQVWVFFDLIENRNRRTS
jgi:hypothetical protein